MAVFKNTMPNGNLRVTCAKIKFHYNYNYKIPGQLTKSTVRKSGPHWNVQLDYIFNNTYLESRLLLLQNKFAILEWESLFFHCCTQPMQYTENHIRNVANVSRRKFGSTTMFVDSTQFPRVKCKIVRTFYMYI